MQFRNQSKKAWIFSVWPQWLWPGPALIAFTGVLEPYQNIHLDGNVEGAFKSPNPILFKKSDYLDKYIEFFQLFYHWC